MKKHSKKNEKKSLKKEYLNCRKFLEEIKWYAVFAFGFFAFFYIIGFAYPHFFREEIFELIRGLFEVFEGKGFVATIGAIFFNNLKTSFFATVLGMGFGIIPVLILVINGYLVGFVSREAANSFGLGVLWRLLPHGILELTAVMFSLGMGLRLGYYSIFSQKDFSKEFNKTMKFFFLVIVPLLFIAAIIETVLIFFFP